MKAELKLNNINQVIKDTIIYEQGDEISSVSLVVKGRIRMSAEGTNIVVGSGNFLGLCDLVGDKYGITYTAETNAVIYAFPKMRLSKAVRSLVKANKDYAGLMVASFSRIIRELSITYEKITAMADKLYEFLLSGRTRYTEIAKEAGIKADNIRSIDDIEEYEQGDVDIDKIMYYRACCEIAPDIQKAYFGASSAISVYHVLEQVKLVNAIIAECGRGTEYLKLLSKPLVKEERSLYMQVFQLANTVQHIGGEAGNVMSLFDDIIDYINTLENLMLDKAGVDLEIDHEFMEETYFSLLNSDVKNDDGNDADIALTEMEYQDISQLNNSLSFILDYSEIEREEALDFEQYITDFDKLRDKFLTDDDTRTLRRNITKMYYKIYKKVFLKDYKSSESTPVIIDLFLRYGFISEKLLSEELLEQLLSIDRHDVGNASCMVYDMKQWLTEIIEGRKEPSKSEFDLDYAESLRDRKRTGALTEQQVNAMADDRNAKFEFEVDNMFKANHRILYGQVSAFVPFLFTDGCASSLLKTFMSGDRINAAVHRLLQIDYSAFYREGLYKGEAEGIKKEYIVEEVFPDFILFPIAGSNPIMWQEISGRRRNSKGRFLLPAFLDTDIDAAMVKLFGRFRWELCRTIQGAAWNNIQVKSLTSEYSDFIQFYKKNRELSEDKKDKLKMQIQKCRNNTREVFVVDYENWIKHEAHGGIVLSKPVREIMATYCPFAKDLRDSVEEQPLFRDAMARYNREKGKKTKEYDLKFRVWDKDKVDVPKEIVKTRDYYVEM
ncbi:cyclic nucleotide-binding protein [Clostridium sp. CAG:122]|uniref:cyclic nucleotide-binding domain-containing protein n=1 Tax=Butyribacter sp. TaxID=2822465 RepID=UPI0003392E77|nr:cyclic nucleotide-binding protein [Clostridium sp. CAG:122]